MPAVARKRKLRILVSDVLVSYMCGGDSQDEEAYDTRSVAKSALFRNAVVF